MEKLKKQRKPIRSMITRTITETEAILANEPIDVLSIKSKYEKLSGLTVQVQNLDQQILDFMMDDEDFNEDIYQTEVEANQDYIDKTIMVKLRIDEVVVQKERLPSESSATAYETTIAAKRQFKLPKIELKKFGGKILDWLGWWSQFKKIHEDTALHTTDKFQYLIQSMEPKTRGYDIVTSFPATDDNYPKAITALKERFGKKKLLTQVYIRELFQLGLKNLNKQADLASMYDTLSSHIRSLESLGVTVEQSTLFLYPMVESSLPEDILIAWQRSSLYEKDGSAEQPPKGELDYLLQFLQQEVERQEQRSLVSNNSNASNNNKKKATSIPTAAHLFNGQQSQSKTPACIFCERSHESRDCAKVENWSIDDMKKKIAEKKSCSKCLKTNHITAKCRSFVKCHLCSQKHVTIMCPDLKKKKTDSARSTSSTSAESVPQQTQGFNGASFDVSGDVLLKTVMAYVCTKTNKQCKKLVRILFDDGCQRSSITKAVSKSIRSIPVRSELTRSILFDGSKTNYENTNIHDLILTNIDATAEFPLTAREKLKVGGNVSKIPKGFWISELESNNIFITDLANYTNETTEIDIAIGSDYWGHVMTGNKQSLSCGLTAFESIFGWTLSGITPTTNEGRETISMYLCDESIKNLWSLDVIGIKDPIEKLTLLQEEAKAKEIFSKNVTRNSEGRYMVKLPWNNGVQEIPNNKKIVTNRLLSITKKLNATNNFETYDKIIRSWIDEGFVRQINDSESKKCHYLPHHPVFKDSATTPVRPVFDASCKTGRAPSLNECLFKGPNYIELLPDTLMRFRMKLVGGLADIRKAFQMIGVDEEDREYLLFLWWEDATQQKIICLQHVRVVFGLICNPFLLAAVLEYHLQSSPIPESQKGIARQLLKALYVDNCVTSFDSHDEFEEFKKISIELLASAKMELRQWEATFKENHEPMGEPEETKVLSMVWNKRHDTLCISVPKIEIPETFTKRKIASVLHKFFDPIGYTCPALLQPKIMLQNAWKKNVSWDCELPELWKNQFQQWCDKVVLLKEIKIPRLCKIPNPTGQELHTFTDASQDAYAAIVFLRTEKDGQNEIQLIQAKNRISPIEKATSQRLELLACLVGSRLGNSVIEALELKNIPTHYWSDCTTALAWIRRNDNWGTFVGNRVRRILQTTNEEQWHHVPGTINPADLPSRGCSPRELLESKWWEGPSWLKLSKEHWPNNVLEYNETEINSEKKKTSVSLLTLEKKSWFIGSGRFVSYVSTVRVMAWIVRFCENLKRKRNKEEKLIPKSMQLSIKEMRDAEVHIIKSIQYESSEDLASEKQFQKFTLDSTIDGAIRVRTPITKGMDSIGFRYPYLLPRHHPLVRQLIYETHLQYSHSGVQFIMGKLREKYWITQTRKTVSSVINGCVRCKRFTANKMTVRSASLPEKRVRSGEIFDTTGVDLFGPMILRNGEKVWAVIYTCAVYRAIQLDIIKSISTPEFIQSLKRFIFHHGRPNDVMSDHGTNFVGTSNLLKAINKIEFEKACGMEKINWEFIPPASPWWGGFWERLVRSVKEPLRRALGNAVVTFDQLKTILMEITSYINDRPLTTVSEDPNDLDPLTPNMFLRGTKNASFPEEEEITDKHLQSEWQRIKQFKNTLLCRFRKEYLGQLVENHKSSTTSTITVGDIVLVGSDNKKRHAWPMARVVELIPGADDHIRVAKVKTKYGCLTRPLQRLYPLEMSKPESRPINPKQAKLHTAENGPGLNAQSTPEIKMVDTKNDEDITKATRSGRQVKKPAKYGWNE